MLQNSLDILTLLGSHGIFLVYTILFLIMCAEGPIITTMAAFVASMGYLNIWIVFILGVFGGIIPDFLFYGIGRMSRIKSLEKIVGYVGLNKKRMKWLGEKIKNNPIKSIAIIKLVPPLPIPGLILTGFLKVDIKKFLFAQTLINTIGTGLFALAGFYSGLLTGNILKYFKLGELLLPIFIIIVTGIYLFSKYVLKHLSKVFKKL